MSLLGCLLKQLIFAVDLQSPTTLRPYLHLQFACTTALFFYSLSPATPAFVYTVYADDNVFAGLGLKSVGVVGSG